jgi:hypothetical protein
MGSLLALSALLASINPILGFVIPSEHAAFIVQLVISSIGSLCAVLGMVTMLLSKVQAMWDKASAAIAIQGSHSACVSEKEILDGKLLVDPAMNVWEDLTNGLESSFGVKIPGVNNGSVRMSPSPK